MLYHDGHDPDPLPFQVETATRHPVGLRRLLVLAASLGALASLLL